LTLIDKLAAELFESAQGR